MSKAQETTGVMSKEACLNQAARNAGYESFADADDITMFAGGLAEIISEAMEIYALAKQIASVERAAEKAKVAKTTLDGWVEGVLPAFNIEGFRYVVDKASITSKDNLV